MRIAIIENDEIVNVIVGDELPANGIECPEKVCLGWIYHNGEFVAPPIVYADVDETETI
jgi:hypothetical protein